MIRYTTPTIPIDVDADLTGAQVYVTINQGDLKITKPVESITVANNVTSFDITLTQEETAKFVANSPVLLQVNFIFQNGNRGATGIQQIKSFNNLYDEVIAYAD